MCHWLQLYIAICKLCIQLIQTDDRFQTKRKSVRKRERKDGRYWGIVKKKEKNREKEEHRSNNKIVEERYRVREKKQGAYYRKKYWKFVQVLRDQEF